MSLTITSAQHVDGDDAAVVIFTLERGAILVHADAAEDAQAALQAWVGGGGLVAPYVEPIVVPKSITPLQARKALRAAGLYDAVAAYIETLSDADKDEWEYAISIERDNAIIAGGAAALGLTQSQVDGLFIAGASL